MPSWPAQAEGMNVTWLAAYRDGVRRLRAATAPVGLIVIAEGPVPLGEKLFDLADRRYPCALLPSKTPGMALIVVCGDPKTAHEVIASRVRKLVIRAAGDIAGFDDLWETGGSPLWKVLVREGGTTGGQYFAPGWAGKEPDFAIWTPADATRAMVVEVALFNESAAELWFEGKMWSQRAQSPWPVRLARNVVALQVLLLTVSGMGFLEDEWI